MSDQGPIHAPLTPYTSPIRGVQPSTEGAQAEEQAARINERYAGQKAELDSQSARALGIAAQSAGHAAGEWVQQAQLHADNQEVSMYGAAGVHRIADATDQWHQIVQQTDPNNLPAARQAFLDKLAQSNDAYQSGAQTNPGRRLAETQANALAEHMFNVTAADVSTGAGIAAHENLQKMVNSGSVAAVRDFSSVDATLQAVDDWAAHSVDTNPNLDPRVKMELHDQITQQAKTQIVGAGIKALIANNPGYAKQVLDSGKYDEALGGSAIDQLTAEAGAAIKAKQVEQRGAVLSALQDNIASIGRTGSLAVAMPSEAQLQSLTPEERIRAGAAMTTAHQEFQARQSVAGNSPAEDDALLAKLEPQGVGYAQQAGVQDHIAAAIQQKRKDLASDPAGFVTANNAGIAKLFQDGFKDMAKLPAAITASRALQLHLGVPEGQVQALPNSMAKTAVGTILSQSPGDRADMLQKLSDATGESFGGIMGSLVGAGLPRGYEMLAVMQGDANHVASANLSAALADPKATAEAAGATGSTEKVMKAIEANASFQDLQGSMSHAINGPDITAEYKSNFALLAQRYIAQGMDPTQAVQKAVGAVTARYDFGSDGERVPKGSLDMVRAAERNALDLKPDALALPRNSTGTPLSDNQLRQIALNATTSGRWVTNESGTGIYRLSSEGQQIMLTNGKRLELLFKDMSHVAPSIALPLPVVNP